MAKSIKKTKIAIDKSSNLCYNGIMKNKGNKMVEQKFTIGGYSFVYVPSLKVLGVTSPTGGLNIHHQIPTPMQAGKLASKIIMKNLEKKQTV